jgi:hypothetical protein
MSGEYSVHLPTGMTIKALVIGPNRAQRFNGTTLVAMSSIADSAWETGLVTMTEQLTDDDTPTGIYVGDHPAELTTTGSYLIEYYDGTVTVGEQNVALQIDEYVNGGGVASTVNAAGLQEAVGRYLGIGTSGWDSDDEDKIDEAILSGRRQFYWPINGHRWSFLRPVQEIDTVVDQADYDLPSSFGGMVGPRIYYSAGDGVWRQVPLVPIGTILAERQQDIGSGVPRIASYVPKTTDGTAAQGFTLALSPAANAVYTLKYQFQVVPSSIGAEYAWGGAEHYETIVAACLAAAERLYRETTVQQEYFKERLMASIESDVRHAPANIGNYRGRGSEPPALSRSNYVTVGGVLYDNT